MTARKAKTIILDMSEVEKPQAPAAADEDGALSPEDDAKVTRIALRKDREDDIRYKVRMLEISEEAKQRVAAKKAGSLVIPKPVRLDRFLRRRIPGTKFLIDKLLPTDGNALLSAPRKYGKTTMVGNLIRSLVDGDPFMGCFEVTEARKVVLLDFEMTELMLQHWLKTQGIKNTRNLSVWPLRGQAATFNILDDRTRARWAQMIKATGAEVLIIDPLRPVLDALGIKEANEVGPLLQAFAALKVEADIREGFIAHHHGHGAQRAVGDSRLETWPDAMWNGTMEDPNDPELPHYFQALGRDVHVPRGVVLMDAFKRLEFKTDVGEESKSVLFDRLVVWLTKALEDDLKAVKAGETLKHEPGERNTGQIEKAGLTGFGGNGRSADPLRQVVKTGRVVLRSEGEGKPNWYSLPPS
ncbi:AAA family ATPase [Microbacterium sp. ZW T5_45]|uniref:AAA family ATPase n=1 Tax=Microbacterium sp. ZW T5_45 TaxID=3378080 RepID=UPI003851DF61